ncbi:MAG: DNA-processing protein DprA [Chthonomonas sp.]|nr:DNA-processing protein DprA [Chthonomonas sp.]
MALGKRTLGLALYLCPGIAGKRLSRILVRNETLGIGTDVFLAMGEASLREEYGLPAKTASGWLVKQKPLIEEANQLEEKLDKFGVGMITSADAHYPEALEEFDDDPPGILFYFGNHKLLNSKTFAILSSRKSSPSALDYAEKLAEEGVLAGEILVTGHGTPEYERAAVVPLRWGSPRIMCLDRGLFDSLGPELKDEPFRAARLWRYQFDRKTDLAISLAHPEKGFVAGANSRRDRLIAGLSKRLDFVNIAPGGNMDKIARMGLKAKRPVRILDSFLGSREWTRYGATMLEL